MRGAYYCKSVAEFLSEPDSSIRDVLTQSTSKSFYQQLSTQTTSWSNFISILKRSLSSIPNIETSGILLEYTIPRRAKRIDALLIANGIIIVIEFKDGDEDEFKNSYSVQLEDYCLDLRDFHLESDNKIIVPLLLCHNGKSRENVFKREVSSVQQTIFSNSSNLNAIITTILKVFADEEIDFQKWNNSTYTPTPTIIEAATSLYAGMDVKEISRSHSGEENLTRTSDAVINAIKEAQTTKSKIICFITGVPGAGKTLAGLNIVHNSSFKTNEKDLGVFLSGNSPLVKVLSEALARDCSKREGITKKEASRKVSTFIHNVHQFIDAYYEDKKILPVDNVLIYDEAQRAWTKEYKYFKSKKTINASEPEILLSIMDRFTNSWAVIIALVGGGQEINTGEGGLAEWGKALTNEFSHWKIFVSPELRSGDHSAGHMTLFKEEPINLTVIENKDLHLKTSIRSYKARELSNWINLVLSNNSVEANIVAKIWLKHFPIFLTRSLEAAKKILKANIRGSRRCGMVASSGGRRLRAIGIDISAGLKGTSNQSELGAWYLNSADDVRSSSFLEIVGSEFGVQGLELDWTCVCWDTDLRRIKNEWAFRSFEGTKWSQVKQPEEQQYILNKYRVLLTRAREGMIIFVPYGDHEDATRLPSFYDPIFDYLISCGLKEI